MEINDDLNKEEFNNQMIDLTHQENLPTLDNKITMNDEQKQETSNSENNTNSSPFENNQIEEQPMDKVENTSEEETKKEAPSKSFLEKLLCVFNFIRPYFKITYNDIKTRIIKSFIPIKNDFLDIVSEKPDLYGPFWIYTTLIYVIAAGGALSYYFTNAVNNYFQLFVPVAGSILYSFGFGFPFVLWLCLKIYKIEMKYVSLICLYGYSLTCFVPVLILCASGFGWIQWILLTYGIANSSAFILINLWNLIKSLEQKNKYIFIGILCGGQFILFLVLKLYFFGSFKPKVVENATNPV